MDWLDILTKIGDGEDVHTEFKSRLDLSAVGRAICAFANTSGGVLILGVTDAGQIVGIDGDRQGVQEGMTSFLHSCCGSPVSAVLGQHEDPNGRVYWIQVPRQRGFEPLRYDGRVLVRRGRSSVEPSSAELQGLCNIFGYIVTGERTMQAGTASGVDIGAFREYLRRQGVDTETCPPPGDIDGLRNRGVLDDPGGEPRLTPMARWPLAGIRRHTSKPATS